MRKVLVLFGILDDLDIDWIVKNGRKVSVPAGAVLIHEGQPTEHVHFVLDGELSVRTGGVSGVEVAQVRAGDVLGEISFVDSRPPSATVVASMASLVGTVDRTVLAARLEENVAFAARFYHSIAVLLADRLRTTTSQLGYGKEPNLDADVDDIDEVPSHLMESLSSAGQRFGEMQTRRWGA